MFNDTCKLIRMEMAADTPSLCQSGILLRNHPEEPIPRRNTENIIDQLKINDIGTDDIILLIRILVQKLPCLLTEKFLAVKAGQPIIPELIDEGGGFPQVNDIGSTVQDDLGFIRLDHKIGSAAGKGCHLFRLSVILCGDNHRDGGKIRVILDHGQELIAIHNGHDNIQQDKGKISLLLP